MRFQCIEQRADVEKRLRSGGAIDLLRSPGNSKSGKEIHRQNNLAGESAILLAASRRAGSVELTSPSGRLDISNLTSPRIRAVSHCGTATMLLGTGVADRTSVLSTASVSWTAVSANDGAESRNSRPTTSSRIPKHISSDISALRPASRKGPLAWRRVRVRTAASEE
jgi:hypothetical protein